MPDPDSDQAAQQLLSAFQNVLPMLDKTLHLEPDPRNPKRRRDQRKQNQLGEQDVPQTNKHMMTMMKLMANILIRQDQEMQQLKRNDSFILYFSKKPTGTLSQLLTAAEAWRKAQETPASSTLKLPLRTHLMNTLLTSLLNRVTEISKAPNGSDLYKATVKNKMLLEDYSWPYLQWCPQTRTNQISAKKAVGMKQMLDMCSELIEHFRNPLLVIRFHSLQSKLDSKVTPWRLQLNMRLDGPFELLSFLCYNSVWAVLGSQLKPHLQQQSPMATALQEMMGKGHGKGQGKSALRSATQKQTAKQEST